jgi:hypothetical protein
MHLIQFNHASTGRSLGVVVGDNVDNITARRPALHSTVAAFHEARRNKQRLDECLAAVIASTPAAPPLSYSELLSSGWVLPPISEESGARVLVSGTGLTHTGSVQQRDAMHKKADTTAPKSDSRRMFEMGLEGGRPAPGHRGAAPEWFFKGDGRILRGPGQALDIPAFAPDGGEEPEIVGLYIIDDDGVPCRLGFTQGNEWSDHVTENVNYLYLAPSKLRVCSIGPELVTHLSFDDIQGRCTVHRNDGLIYDSGILFTGDRNMCHSLANIEDHHFKFPQHRIPGDVHVHFFGTSKLSFQHRDWKYQTGDLIEVTFAGLGAPLRNPVQKCTADEQPIGVEQG